MVAELVLAAVAAADLCLKYGRRLVDAYQEMKRADETIETTLLAIEAMWSRTSIQIQFVKRILRELEPEHCRVHLQVFERLQAKLRAAVFKIESVIAPGTGPGVKKFKFLLHRSDFRELIPELEQWQRAFDPTWYLILRMGDRRVDDELSACESSGSSDRTLVSARKLRDTLMDDVSEQIHVSLNENGLDWSRATSVRYSTTRIILRTGSDPAKQQRAYAVDTINCSPSLDVGRTRADAEMLAKKLSQVDPNACGLLSCHGLVKRRQPSSRRLASIDLVFHLPTQTAHPSSLREHLLHSTSFSMSRILRIAQQLARAASFVHTCDFVHKNIRPETILVYPDETATTPCPLGNAYLLGFDSFRSVNFHTLRSGDAAWDRNLYRHPQRQGIFTQDVYVMQHDVYSLGVCLLELGLWQSFVEIRTGKQAEDGSVSEETLPSQCLGLSLQDFDFMKSKTMQASASIKDHLVEMAKSRLPMRMGDKYTAVVLTCLTCLDQGNDIGNDEDMHDDDGILVGVRFIERVVLKLGEISM